MSGAGIETASVSPRCGGDAVTLGDVGSVGVTSVASELGSDGAADTIAGQRHRSRRHNHHRRVGNTVQVTGSTSAITIGGAQASDRLIVNGLGGGDTLSGWRRSRADPADARRRRRRRHAQRRQRRRQLIGGAGDDTVDGNQGNDTATLGAGNDTSAGIPATAATSSTGRRDPDTLRFNGSAGAEIFTASANGQRLLFTRNVGNIVMDVDNVETLAAERPRRRGHG